MSLLRWSPAGRGDVDALRLFRCTPKGRNVRRFGTWELDHPRPHELRVQALICHHLKPVGDRDRTVLLGWEGADLGGVTTYRRIGSGAYMIDVLAIAERFRHRRGGWGREALSTTLGYITADTDEDGYNVAGVSALIHEDNRASQRIFELERFEITALRDDGYQVWSADLIIEGADLPEDF